MRQILAEVAAQQVTEERIWRRLVQDMKDARIDVLDYRKISKVDEVMSKKIFTELRPMLSPRVVDGMHPFPFLDNGELCVVAMLGKPDSFRLGLVSLFGCRNTRCSTWTAGRRWP